MTLIKRSMEPKKMTENETDKRAEDQRNKFLTFLITAQSSLWNSLLMANGIVIGILSLIVAIRGPSLTPWAEIIFIAALIITFLAIIAMLWCFRSERDHHQKLLDMSMEPPPELKELERRSECEIQQICRIRKARLWLEHIGTVTIIADLIIILVIIFFGGTNN